MSHHQSYYYHHSTLLIRNLCRASLVVPRQPLPAALRTAVNKRLITNSFAGAIASSSSASASAASYPHRQQRTMATNGAQALRLKNPAVFICDIQVKFARGIYRFDKIVSTTQKLLKFANSFSIPVHVTTQISAKLGDTVPELASLLKDPPHDKTLFSMCIPSVMKDVPKQSAIALVGIEAHICITQTAIDLRNEGHHVFVIADGVSSANKGEVYIALERLRSESGITVTTSESWMYQCVGDAKHPDFKKLLDIVKSYQNETKATLDVLPPGPGLQ